MKHGYIEEPDGRKDWFLNGELHRTDGPATEWPDGSKYWYLNGELHRTDGPAIECSDGRKYWYLNGQELTKKKWKKIGKPSVKAKLVKCLKHLLST